MQLRLATYADKEAWDEYVLGHQCGTAYHLFAWREAIEKSYNFMGLYLIAEHKSGFCGVLPMIDFRIPLLGSTLISLPYCDAGGALADSQEIERELINYARSIAEEKNVGFNLRSSRPILSCGENQTNKVSMILELPDQSEQLLLGFKSKFRLKIKKPARDGLTVVMGKEELLDEFYAVFKENMRDLGSPVHSRFWIRNIISAYEDRARIAVAYTPDKVHAAAGIILLHPFRVSNPWASSLRRYNHMRPNTLLYWTLLAFASDNGFGKFDFGRSTPDEGTYHFKSQWGAKPCPLYWYELDSSKAVGRHPSGHACHQPGKAPTGRQIAANLWQRLPQYGTDWLGPKIRKYISL